MLPFTMRTFCDMLTGKPFNMDGCASPPFALFVALNLLYLYSTCSALLCFPLRSAQAAGGNEVRVGGVGANYRAGLNLNGNDLR